MNIVHPQIQDARPRAHPARAQGLALAGLLLAEAMNLLDSTITTVVAPAIRTSLGGTAADAQWVVAAYTLPFAILLILGGRLGDIAGRRRMFVVGVVGFLVTSAGCAGAPTMALMLTSRALQGAFAAMVIPQTIGLIRAMFTGPALPRALGFIGPVMALTAVSGPVLGGLITQADLFGLSWRAAFLINLPLGVLVLCSAALLTEDRHPSRPGLDPLGLALAAVVGAGLVIPAINGQAAGWPVWTWVCLAGAGIGSVLLALHIRRTGRPGGDPIVEPSPFHDRGFPAALMVSLLYFATSTGIVFVVALLFESTFHASVLRASLVVLPFSIGLGLASVLAGARLVPRYGPRLMLGGIAVLTVGLLTTCWSAVRLPEHGYPWALAIGLGIAGLGGGATTVPFFTAALSRVRPHETGSAAGLLNAVQQLGGTIGVAAFGTIASHTGDGLAVVSGVMAVVALPLALAARAMLREGDPLG